MEGKIGLCGGGQAGVETWGGEHRVALKKWQNPDI